MRAPLLTSCVRRRGGKRTKAKDVLPLYEAHALSPLGHKVFSAWLSYDRAAKRLLTGLAESV